MLAPSSALLAHIDIPPRLLASLIVLGIVVVIWIFKAMLSSPAKPPQAPPPGPWGQPPPPQQGYHPQAPPQGYNPYAQQPPQQAMQQQQPQVPFCGTCGGPGRWLPEANAWGCDRCRQLIQPR